MKKIYTCFACGFPLVFDEQDVPDYCPGCGAPRSQFLEEPWTGSLETRRIHVDPPQPDPNRDPYDISFHVCKDFAPRKGDGRVRRFVMGYHDGEAEAVKSFYEDCFGWDIIDTKDTDESKPVMYAVTGPSDEEWEPTVVSFGNGFIKKDEGNDGPAPSFIVEVKDIDETIEKTLKWGGKLIRERFKFQGDDYAIVEDSEGNQFYIWELKNEVPYYCNQTITNTGAQ